jgi:8-amino-7-oxononanoate synthase
MSSLDAYADRKRAALKARDELRALVPAVREDGAVIERAGRRLVSFSCNDYLGLSGHPAVIAAAGAALAEAGLGAGASRLVTGNHPLHAALEKKLAQLKDTEDALIFGSGYLANLGIVPALVGPGDLILVDMLAHACLMSGSRLSGAREIRFAHNDIRAVRAALSEHRAAYRHCLILTDGVFSMDGDLAPLPELAELARSHDAWLMTDDAHGLGVLGGGRGSAFAFGPEKIDVPLQMGTLSKALGAYGGYVCASARVIDLLRSRARTLVYSTALPPAVLAGAIAALDIVAQEPERVARPLALARRFTAALNLPLAESAIVPIVLGESRHALAAMAALEGAGYLVTAIRPPTVPAGTARLRFAFSAAQDEADVDGLIEAVRVHVLPKLGR